MDAALAPICSRERIELGWDGVILRLRGQRSRGEKGGPESPPEELGCVVFSQAEGDATVERHEVENDVDAVSVCVRPSGSDALPCAFLVIAAVLNRVGD